MAAMMENQGEIFAFDLSLERCREMTRILQVHGVTCATAVNMYYLFLFC